MKRITEIRTYLMGVAILCVMFFHTSGFFVVPEFLTFFQTYGYLGVDIFFFLSAYGLYYSLTKQTPLKQWYKRRFIRIVPAFVCVILFHECVVWIFGDSPYEGSFGLFAKNFLHYFVVFWYIPALLSFYLFFPFLYKHRKYVLLLFLPITIFSFWIPSVLLDVLGSKDYVNAINGFFFRIPVFLLGLIWADNETVIYNKMNIWLIRLLVCASFSFFVLFYLGMLYVLGPRVFIYLIFILPAIICLCFLCKQYVFPLSPFLEFCGKYSLELYLLHVIFKSLVINKLIFTDINANYTFIGAYVLSFPCAWLFSKGLSMVLNYKLNK